MNMDERVRFTNTLSETLIYEVTKALALPQTELVRKVIARLLGKAIRRFTQSAHNVLKTHMVKV